MTFATIPAVLRPHPSKKGNLFYFSMKKDIELELRAAVKKEEYKKLLSKLRKSGTLLSHTRRLSVMFFGSFNNEQFDVRVRITDGKAEVVIKKGEYHSHNRTENSQAITKEQLPGFAEIFSRFGFKSKVGERETCNFRLGRDITVSLVNSGKLAYIEIEKMTGKKHEEDDKLILEEVAENFGLRLIRTAEEFDTLCDKLTRQEDWAFTGSDKDVAKLKKSLKRY